MAQKTGLKAEENIIHVSGIIGTAGHIDHGKTSLVMALTGIDTDRLVEEKKRAISIDIGFAHLDFKDGDNIARAAIVDVPGHEKFIKNMLVGATGFTAVMFIVAADDGVMPQTTEHFKIVRLLGVTKAVFVITKIDLVEKARIEAVKNEIEEMIRATVFKGSRVCAVSSVSREGIEELRGVLKGFIAGNNEERSAGLFRLPVDRVFAVKGFGTVVTGTIASGTISKGDDAVCFPSGKAVKVRGIQSLYMTTDTAGAGMRAALNLGGVSHADLKRGDMIMDSRLAGFLLKTGQTRHYIDAAVEFVADPVTYLKSERKSLKVHYLATDAIAAMRFDKIKNGKNEYFCRMTVNQPFFAAVGDRFIIRDTSLNETIGGGRVILSYISQRSMPRFTAARNLLNKSAGEMLAAYIGLCGFIEARAASAMLNSPVQSLVKRAANDDNNDDAQMVFIGRFITSRLILKKLEELAMEIIKSGVLRGANIDELYLLKHLQSRVDYYLSLEFLRLALDRIVASGDAIKDGRFFLPRVMPETDAVLGATEEAVLKLLPSGYNALYVDDLLKLGIKKAEVEKTIAALLKKGLIIRLSETALIASGSVDTARRLLLDYLAARHQIKASEFRDMLGCGRKLAIEMLEYFDKERITLRKGDVRTRR